jgi:hypothetical protein
MTSTPTPPLGQQPSRMPTADLGGVFGAGPDRTRGLAGRLAPVAAPPPAPEPVAPPEPAAPEPAAPVKPSTQEPRPVPMVRDAKPRRPKSEPASPPRTAPAEALGGDRRVVVVYVRASLRGRLRTAAAARPDVTHTDLVLAALDATHDQLGAQFQGTRTGAPGSMFSGRQGRRRLRHEEPQVQLSIRPWADDLAIIDRLVEEAEAPSRSALVDAALDSYLPGRD